VNRAAFNRSPTRFGEEKGAAMKFATISKSFVIGLALLVAASAFAATKGSLQISDPVTLNGTTLKPGDYKVEWDGSGPNVQLSIMHGKNVVAKTSAKLVDLPAPAANDAAVTIKNDSGPNSLAGIRFQGKKYALDLNQSSEAMQSGASQ
jgi:hypothetical protein